MYPAIAAIINNYRKDGSIIAVH